MLNDRKEQTRRFQQKKTLNAFVPPYRKSLPDCFFRKAFCCADVFLNPLQLSTVL
jgi:hypothetical protein